MLSSRRSTVLKFQLALVSASIFSLYLYYGGAGETGSHHQANSYFARHLLQAPGAEDETVTISAKPNITENPEESDSCGYQPSDSALFPPNTFTDDQLGQGAIVLYIIGVLYMFYALAIICDHFFVPSLEVIIEKFNISQDVAGATLMAAGGSAPELFTSIIGVFIAQSDVGTGTIVGSAVFNVLFVIAACAFASVKALSLTAWPLIRDTTFYSVALGLLVGFFSDSRVYWWEALILFLWYIFYVVFMKFNVAAETRFHTIFPSLKAQEADTDNFIAWGRFDPNRTPLFSWMQGQVKGKASSKVDDIEQKAPKGIHQLKKTLENKDKEEPDNEETEKAVEEEEGNTMLDNQDQDDYEDVVCTGPTGTVYSKLIWFVTMPLMIPMWITTPDPNNPSRKKFFAMTFVMSIVWIMVFSYLMVWWTTVIGNFAGIPATVMGLTFLAAGTSVPDLITSVIVAKQGHGDMAVSSSIGSNIFDVCVGLPVPWMLYTLAFNTPYMSIDSAGMGCNVGMLFFMLILVFVSIMAFKWKMTKMMGGIMLVLYAIFVTVSLLFSFCIFSCDFM